MYSSKTGLKTQNNREWVSWKQILLHFVLINSSLPTEKELANLRVKLSEAGEAQLINKESFMKVSKNFDIQHFVDSILVRPS
jgi:hypothetical protein